ncbi:precorrin-2 dehydrogenase/sirohydrochlorin ferrochelatase family protein [Croceicoccus mobilis]|uniref:precorrin-2 dehydrogenase n=1 Tax=Croceicoccus mobilis TaxID=1703339 RepID=A0A916Z0B5_9SPHN|nr:bifunctional precorrin-2 dehydrogenase/sirohydrochlorin ferrochelatase [Croceicoccus mobilis]GGD68433.1 siroheme synthase [Croceicoccus mobilis]
MNSLPLFHRIDGKRVVVLGVGEAAEAKRRIIRRAGGICVSEHEAHHASLGFVVIDDDREAEAAAMRLRMKGLIVNVTDKPALCDFTVPSLIDRDPVLIAVGTGGASAGLAKMLRLRLERMLPQGLGRLASALGAARAAIRSRYPTAADRRRALDNALGEGGALDPLVEHGEGAVDRWLAGKVERPDSGVHEFTLQSGDPDDLTLRQARLLGSADYVVHDPAVPEAVLVRARADAQRIGGNEMPEIGEEEIAIVLRLPK